MLVVQVLDPVVDPVENSTADSPSRAIIGSPKTTRTVGRPGTGQERPLGIAS